MKKLINFGFTMIRVTKRTNLNLFFGVQFFLFVASLSGFSDTVKLSHSVVMNSDFPDKKAVFLKFGTPSSKSILGEIENWYYKIGEITETSNTTMEFGFGQYQQNYLNFITPDIWKVVENTNINKSVQTGISKTTESYIKFWFVNDTVLKWESVGVDFSRIQIVYNSESAGEFLFDDFESNLRVYSHISKLRKLNSGINGPMGYVEVNSWLDNHPDFNKAFLPTIDDLKKLFSTNTSLRNTLFKSGLVVWSDTQNDENDVLCLDFSTGNIVACNKESKHIFVPFVGVRIK